MNIIEKIYDFENGDRYVVETNLCFHCGNKGTVEVLAQEVFYLRQGMLIQDAVKSLDKGLREQLMSGTHPKCWLDMFGEEE
jgi:hypothetical protein